MKKIIFILYVLFPLSFLYSAEIYSGRDTVMSIFSTESTGRGGTGVSASGGSGFFFLNPASIGLNEKFSLDLKYGTLQGSYYNPDISLSFPTPYGTIGGGLKFIYLPNSSDVNYATAFSFGGAKSFGGKFLIGGSLNFIWAQAGSDLFYIGGSAGFIYRFDGTSSNYTFGLFEPAIGLSINAGFPIGNNISFIDFNSITAGYNFKFINAKYFKLGFFNDFTVIHSYTGFTVKAGLEAEFFKGIYLRGGGIFNVIPSTSDFADATFGAGYKLKNEDFTIALNYSFIFYRDMKFVHYISIGTEFGSFSADLPETEIIPDRKYFSPDHDGINDFVTFKINADSKQPIAGWRFQITDISGKVIKEFKKTDRDLSTTAFGGFFTRLVSKKSFGTYPDIITWDGTGRDGMILPEGKYDYSFIVWDDNGNISSAKTGSVVIDITHPEITVKSESLTFIPGKENFVISQIIKGADNDKWRGGFKNSRGTIVKNFKWENLPPPKITWDGTDDAGKDAPEGIYSFFIFSEDEAGNSTREEIKQIALYRKTDTPDITSSEEYFSYSLKKGINFFLKNVSNDEIITWKIIIENNMKRTVREISGKNKFPSEIKWDCLDSNGEKLSDGEYNYYLICELKNNKKSESLKRTIIFDSRPPSLHIGHSPELFSPDGDGENDILSIKIGVDSMAGIKEWKVVIISPFEEEFKIFKGTGNIPSEIKWDGFGSGKELVDPDSVYTIKIEAVDRAGNISKAAMDRVEVDVLVLETDQGFLMRLKTVDFLIESSVLTSGGRRILNRAYHIFEKYDKYKILIEAHTDEAENDKKNLQLSEDRAKAVRDYLVSNGIKQERMSFRGLGETAPVYTNSGSENSRSNKRIDFLLYK